MSRQGTIVAAVVAAGMAVCAAASLSDRDRAITVGFWFEDVRGAGPDGFAERFGGHLTPPELLAIQAAASGELRAAFSGGNLELSGSRAAMYRIRVLDRFRGPRMFLPIAGVSRPLPGRSGEAAVNFSFVAGSALAYAPADASRDTVIDAIGRGIGRTAAHELAHLVLRGFPLHNTTDRRSYEYPHLRAEHFYAEMHWGVASGRLQERLGLPQAHAD